MVTGFLLSTMVYVTYNIPQQTDYLMKTHIIQIGLVAPEITEFK